LTRRQEGFAVVSISEVWQEERVQGRRKEVSSRAHFPSPTSLLLLLSADSPITKYLIIAAKKATHIVATHAYCGQLGLSVDLDLDEEGGILANKSERSERGPGVEEGAWIGEGK